MRLKIDLKIFLFLLLFLITSQFEIYIIVMIFAVIHEIGHLITGILLKFKVEEMQLTPMGISLGFKIETKEYNKKIKKGNRLNIKKAIIAIAGPVINLIIICILMIVNYFFPNFLDIYVYQICIYSNLIIAIFNLIPIYPMDGGRIIYEMLKIFKGYKKAYKLTYLMSKTVLIILTIISSISILYLKNISILFIIGYLWFLEFQEIRRYNKRKNIEKMVEYVEKREHNMV